MVQALPAATTTKPNKAIWAGILSGLFAFLNSISSALQGEHSGWGTITAGQWVTAAVGTLAAFGATGGVTYAVRNKPAG
jgi:hypothetical protein